LRFIQNDYRSDNPHILHYLRQEVAEGLLYTHSRLNANTAKTLEAAAFIYALVELLCEKGIISLEELDQHKRVIGKRLAENFKKKNMGAMLQDPEYDKYTFSENASIDCAQRIYLCRGACCRIPFALSKQDIREGIVHWRLGEPYLIEHGRDGYCAHLEPGNSGCSIYEHRPVPCRAFDCRKDSRIWLDFAKEKINPDVYRPDWPECLASTLDPPV
jgi:Fe-S-cluster containining protein